MLPFGSRMAVLVAKRKCGVDFVYLKEGCGMTHVRINEAIPHARIDMEYGRTECALP